MIRSDGRSPEDLRPVTIEPGYLLYAEGSALIKTGNTAVLCAVTVEDGVPLFARGSGSGWVAVRAGRRPPPLGCPDGGPVRHNTALYGDLTPIENLRFYPRLQYLPSGRS